MIPTSPELTAFRPWAPAADVIRTAKITGGDLVAARQRLDEAIAAKENFLAKAAPEVKIELDTLRARAINTCTDWHNILEDTFSAYHELEQLFEKRAAVILSIENDEAALSEARRILDDPSSTAIGGPELLVLSQRVQHGPSTLNDITIQLHKLEVSIRELLRVHLYIDLEFLTTSLVSRGVQLRLLSIPKAP